MNFEAVLTESVAEQAKAHLLDRIRDGELQEDLCFALWRPSTGATRTTGIVCELLLPLDGERNLHRNASFESAYLGRAVRRACQTSTGVAFMHSHPATGWQGMSPEDVIAERDRIAPPSRATGLQLLGLTVGEDGVWSARFWRWDGNKFDCVWCDRVRVVGRGLNLSIHPSNPAPIVSSVRMRRTVDTWGDDRQAVLSSLRTGIVGLGSVGCVIAETLARIGVTDILLVDADRVEEHNLDRLLYASTSDIGRFKVDLAEGWLKRNATAARFHVDARRAWIQERDAFEAALDCDVLFAAVDRPLPKDVLNNIAYIHCIPVVFGGVRVAKKPDGSLADATWSVVRAGPGSRCLRCDGQYTTSAVMMERDGSLDDPTYVVRGNSTDAAPGNENVFPFSANLGSLMVLEMLRSILRESWWPPAPTKLHYTYVSNRMTSAVAECWPGCSVAEREAQGNAWSYPFIKEPVFREQPATSDDNFLASCIGLLQRARDTFFRRKHT